jgi:anaphase-promoting complex subunit 5
MNRYLTPSKISLLVLASLYCDSVVPNQAIIPVLSFIVTRLIPSTTPANTTSSGATINSAVSIDDLERLTRSHPSNQPGRTLYDQFLKRIWSIDCLHSLHQFFRDLGEYVVPPHDANPDEVVPRPTGHVILTRVSPLGMFIRRAQLEYTRIQFHDAVNLWTAFLKFRAPTEDAWRKRNPSAARLSFDAGISDLSLENKDDLLQACYGSLDANDLDDAEFSTEDIEAMLEFQLDRLQSESRPCSRSPAAQYSRPQSLVIECRKI